MVRLVRWVLVLPGAAVAGYAAWGILGFLLGFGVRLEFMGRGFLEALSSGTLGAAVVYFGALIAPRSRGHVAMGLFALEGVGTIALLVIAFQDHYVWGAYGLACTLYGGGAVAWSMYRNELGDHQHFIIEQILYFTFALGAIACTSAGIGALQANRRASWLYFSAAIFLTLLAVRSWQRHSTGLRASPGAGPPPPGD